MSGSREDQLSLATKLGGKRGQSPIGRQEARRTREDDGRKQVRVHEADSTTHQPAALDELQHLWIARHRSARCENAPAGNGAKSWLRSSEHGEPPSAFPRNECAKPFVNDGIIFL